MNAPVANVSLQEIEQRIDTFVRGTLRPPGEGLERGVDLFEGGFVDSVGVIELLAFLETEFQVQIPEEDLLSADFSRIEGIARIIERQLRGNGEPRA